MSDFSSTWKTIAANESITLPLKAGETYNCVVDWGDGSATSTITAYDDADRIHIYTAPGEHEITMSGTFPGFFFNGTAVSKDNILRVNDWGTVGYSIAPHGFEGCSNLFVLDSANAGWFSSLTDASFMFAGCKSLAFITSIALTDLEVGESMFDGCENLIWFGVSGFTSLVNGAAMFRGCAALGKGTQQPPSLADLANLEIGDHMFEGCVGISEFQPYGDFDRALNPTSYLTNLPSAIGMFKNVGRVKMGDHAVYLSRLTDGTEMFAGSALHINSYEAFAFGLLLAAVWRTETVTIDFGDSKRNSWVDEQLQAVASEWPELTVLDAGFKQSDDVPRACVFPPVISGIPKSGEILRIKKPGSWRGGEEFMAEYLVGTGQWYLNGSPISGATGQSLLVPSGVSVGDEITYSDILVRSESSAAVTVVPGSLEPDGPTHPLFPVLGNKVVKDVWFDNDEYHDSFTYELAVALHLQGKINLVGMSQTISSGDTYNTSGALYDSSYVAAQGTALQAMLSIMEKSGWNVSGVPAPLPLREGYYIKSGWSHPDALSLVQASLGNDAENPLVVALGGQMTILACAYDLDPSIVNRVVVTFVAGPIYSNAGWTTAGGYYNEWADAEAAALVHEHFNVVCCPIHQTLSQFDSFPTVSIAKLNAELPASPLRSSMTSRSNPFNNLPFRTGFNIDGDAPCLLVLVDPGIYPTVQRRSATSTVNTNQDTGQTRAVPECTADSAGNTYWATSFSKAALDAAWWESFTRPALWMSEADWVFTVVAEDDFDRADNGNLDGSAGWGQLGTITRNAIISNQAGRSSSGYAYDARTDTYDADQFCQFMVPNTPVSGWFASPAVRASSRSATVANYVMAYPVVRILRLANLARCGIFTRHRLRGSAYRYARLRGWGCVARGCSRRASHRLAQSVRGRDRRRDRGRWVSTRRLGSQRSGFALGQARHAQLPFDDRIVRIC